MRALLDTNIYISYLLPSTQAGTIQAIIEAIEGRFTPLVPLALIEEFSRKVATKKYLARRILPEEATRLMSIIAEIAEVVPEIPEAIPRVARDEKDDYLLAHALIAKATYLVTGDEDLLALGKVDGVKIVRPAEFLRVLQEASG